MSDSRKFMLVMASQAKRALQGEMPPAMRLEFLRHLEKMVDNVLTPAAIGMVEPICDKGLQIVSEAKKLGWPEAFKVYAEKFDVFAALNPSLQAALDEARRPWMKASA